jgi:hypothetical protein
MPSQKKRKIWHTAGLFSTVLWSLCEKDNAFFNGILPTSVALGCKVLRELVHSGRLKCKSVLLVFPAVTERNSAFTYNKRLLHMQHAYRQCTGRFPWAYTVVGVTACAPRHRGVSSLFYDVMRKMLRRHVGTVSVLRLTLSRPSQVKALHAFLEVLSTCTNTLDLQMDVRKLVMHASCDECLARKVEAVVCEMKKLRRLSWSGFFEEDDVLYISDQEVLVGQLPNSIEELRMAGTMTQAMTEANKNAFLFKFEQNTLQNLKLVDLYNYEHKAGDHVNQGHVHTALAHENSRVDRLILSKDWMQENRIAWGDSIVAVCRQGMWLSAADSDKVFTVVILQPDAADSAMQVAFVEGAVRARKLGNVAVETYA